MNALTVAIVKNKKVEIANAYGRLAKALVNVKKYDEALQNDKIALGFYNELLSAKTAGNKITLLNPQANIYFDIATIYTLKGDNPSALNNYLMALSILERTGLKSVINETNLKIGNIYTIYDSYELALVHYYRTLKGNAELGVKGGIINSYQKIGDVYLKQNKLEAAYSCFSQSERFSKLFFDTNKRIVSLNRLADLFIRIKNNTAALKCIKIAMNLHSSAGTKEMAYESYDNLGHLNIRQGNFTEALNNFYKALEIKKEDENKVSIINSYYDIGNTLINANQNKTDAYAYLNWGLAIAKDIGDYKISQEFYKSLAFLDSITGNIKQSAMHLRMSKTLEDIIKNDESAKEIVRSQLTYEFDKQIKKSEDDRRNQLRILLIFIIF